MVIGMHEHAKFPDGSFAMLGGHGDAEVALVRHEDPPHGEAYLYVRGVEALLERCEKAGFEAVRTDTRPPSNTHQIIDEIHDHIQTCGFVIADLTNERPNVYYEIGYAMALGKKLILTSKAGSD